MPIDVTEALDAPPRTRRIRWTDRDVRLYHLGLGAGIPATDPAELRYTLERSLHVLPSFATVAGGVSVIDALTLPGLDLDLTAVLHGGHDLLVHRPLPVAGEATLRQSVHAVQDKGTAALLTVRSQAADEDGPLWRSDARFFVRGEGGFGGAGGAAAERGATVRRPDPDRKPDAVVERALRADQALLYRLSGDANPLHADPDFARRAGFARPVLHGLCTYGVVLKAVVDALPDGVGGPERVTDFDARFAGVVYPGETLRIALWWEADAVRVRAVVRERGDALALSDGLVTLASAASS
jgi:acyl dehydratase